MWAFRITDNDMTTPYFRFAKYTQELISNHETKIEGNLTWKELDMRAAVSWCSGLVKEVILF